MIANRAKISANLMPKYDKSSDAKNMTTHMQKRAIMDANAHLNINQIMFVNDMLISLTMTSVVSDIFHFPFFFRSAST